MESLTPIQIVYSAIVVIAAYAVRGAAGFGSGVVAIPLLALVLPMPVIVPVITLLGFIASIGHGVRDRRLIVWRELLKLLPSTVVGVLAGLYLFTTLDPKTLTKALGVFVIAYAAYSLLNLKRAAPLVKKATWLIVAPIGVLAGLIATLFGGMAGPVYVVYLDSLWLEKSQFRVTIATILLALAAMRLVGYFGVGFLNLATLLVFAAGLPMMATGMVIGEHIHIKVSQQTFSRSVGVLLVVSGVALLVK